MDRKRLSCLIAIAISLSGCESPIQEQSAASKERQTSDVMKVAIPPQFQGKWSEDCENEDSTSFLLIEPDQLNFYESSGPIRAVVQRGEFEVALISELSGEGEARLALSKFRLTGGNNNLIDVTNESAPYIRYKCDSESEQQTSPDVTPGKSSTKIGSQASLNELALAVENTPYSKARKILQASGYVPSGGENPSRFNMAVLEDPAECGNQGCSIPWKGKGATFCVGVSVNDNVDESQWISGVVRDGSSTSLPAQACPQ